MSNVIWINRPTKTARIAKKVRINAKGFARDMADYAVATTAVPVAVVRTAIVIGKAFVPETKSND